MSESERLVECIRISRELAAEFELLNAGGDRDLLPTFRQRATGLDYKLIPSAVFRMGLSHEEEKAARLLCDPPPLNIEEMRPVTSVETGTFLITRTPVITRDYVRLQQSTDCEYPDMPAHVVFDEAMTFAKGVGCRLPYEREWEFACRATTQTLFVWGDGMLSDAELEKWLLAEFEESYEESMDCNRFGLFCLFDGEWCLDEWRPSYDPSTPICQGEHVVRGGGSLFWPWQADEWVWCMSAMRMPERNLFEGRTAAFRLVREL